MKERRLFRCDCGGLFWEDSPQEIQKRHLGHHYRYAQDGNFWEWFKMKTGFIK
jgi:hypothetical protein